MDSEQQSAKSHVLNSKWTFWYEKRNTSLRDEEWSKQFKKVKTFDNIADFWTLYYNMMSITELPFNTKYHFFKEGIEPAWEDKMNQNGGSFRVPIYRYNVQDTEDKWLKLVLLTLGEQLDPTGENICGISFIMKKKDLSRMEIWTKDCTSEAVIASIASRIRDHKLVSPEDVIDYVKHGKHCLYEV